MNNPTVSKEAVVRQESRKLKRELTLLPLAGLIYFTVCGGSYGIEALFSSSGPGMALLLIALVPIFFSIPNMLMVREMNSMMPVEGGYYHWVKQAYGRFPGYMAGWMNWVVSWVDVSIYPVLGAYYLGFFFPVLRTGTQVSGIDVPAWVLQWLVALVLIWGISGLNLRGARLAGLTTNWLGLIMLLPLLLMSVIGLYNWIHQGIGVVHMPFMLEGQDLTGAMSIGLFIVIWNYMGWELPTAAGDEIVNPKRTYPLAMLIVLILTIGTYVFPSLSGLYGGAGADGRYQLWGVEVADGSTLADTVKDAGITSDQLTTWGVDPTTSVGWEFPDIAQAVGAQATGDPNSPLAKFLGITVMIGAILSMIGLFIGNGLGGTRVPFAMAEDGMMPKFLVKVHPRFGTPWIAILFCGIIFSIFSLQAFAFLVVVDVFLNMLVLEAQFIALWVLRVKLKGVSRKEIPGGYFGLFLATLFPTAIIILAIYSQVAESGLESIGLALAAMAIGAVLYFPILKWVKPGIPDVDPFQSGEDQPEILEPAIPELAGASGD